MKFVFCKNNNLNASDKNSILFILLAYNVMLICLIPFIYLNFNYQILAFFICYLLFSINIYFKFDKLEIRDISIFNMYFLNFIISPLILYLFKDNILILIPFIFISTPLAIILRRIKYQIYIGYLNILFKLVLVLIYIFNIVENHNINLKIMVFELIVIVSYCFFIIAFLRNSNYSIKKSSSDLFALINKDELTQLYNRHYLSNVLEKSNKKFSFALADIDNFKQINDIYGHSTGDFVLKEVSRIFKKYKNEKLTIVRFGGDEFLFIFECDNEKEIIRLMEKIRKEIEEKDFGQDLRSDKVSISCGVTKCSIVNSWNETFETVDKALYKAKEEGRNRVCFIN